MTKNVSLEKKAITVTIAIESIINFTINLLLNGLCAWLIYKNAEIVPANFWSIAIDTYITAHCICVLVTLFTAASARRYFRRGTFTKTEEYSRVLADFPGKPWLLGLTLAECASLLLIIIFGGAFAILEITQVLLWQFVLFKSVWGGILGAVVCVFVLKRYLICGI